jgi:outer membrane protein
MRLSLKTLLLAAALALPSSAAFAETMREVQQQIMLLINQGDYDAAIAVAQAYEPDHPNHDARVDFVRGMVAKAQGKNDVAVDAFRKVLAVQPELEPARQQLAHALFLEGDYEASRHHFDILQTTTSDPRLRQLYAGYARAIDAKRPWTLSGYVTLAPSTNVNKGSDNQTATLFGNSGWTIPEDQQKKSGLGVAVGASGTYAFKMNDGLALVFGAGADGRIYADREDDVMRLNTSLKPTFETRDTRVSIGPYLAASFSGYDRSLTQYGIDADIGVKLDQGLLFSGSVAGLLQNYENDARDGQKYSVDIGLTKSLGASTTVSVMGGLVIENAERVDYDHKDWSVGFSFGREWEGGFISRAEFSVGQHIYDGELGGKTESRKDNVYSTGLQLSNRNFSAMGFMPILNYGFTRQKSNDEFSDYSSHDLAITLTRSF